MKLNKNLTTIKNSRRNEREFFINNKYFDKRRVKQFSLLPGQTYQFHQPPYSFLVNIYHE